MESLESPKLKQTLSFLHREIAKVNGRRIVMTSSFQTQSVPLLHIISTHFPQVIICFIDTGFHFAQTYAFKDQLNAAFKLNLIELRSDQGYSEQLDENGLFLYASDTDKCCHINKVKPLQQFLRDSDVWISGVRRDQTENRAKMEPKRKNARGILRLHPMLEWTSKDIYNYIETHNLPTHPLDIAGYESIGCVPCTNPCDDVRQGRWEGSQKTECGLHLDKK
ncbi:MAG: phosphoadenylyl-sulfate reductase [Bacteroidetes bacterium]|jgi:phosphoadenosine phosphosulfate reductase|nr:phosphoadenylyl-sulfate reductase [Bacteroidota bacterium]